MPVQPVPQDDASSQQSNPKPSIEVRQSRGRNIHSRAVTREVKRPASKELSSRPKSNVKVVKPPIARAAAADAPGERAPSWVKSDP
jgi:hypothetical protein